MLSVNLSEAVLAQEGIVPMKVVAVTAYQLQPGAWTDAGAGIRDAALAGCDDGQGVGIRLGVRRSP